MKDLIRVRTLREAECARLVWEFGQYGTSLSEALLYSFVAEESAGLRSTFVAEVQTHTMAFVGIASVRHGSGRPFASEHSRASELCLLRVPPRFRRQGVATRLLQQAEGEARARGRVLFVSADTVRADDGLQAFLTWHGFGPLETDVLPADTSSESLAGVVWMKAQRASG